MESVIGGTKINMASRLIKQVAQKDGHSCGLRVVEAFYRHYFRLNRKKERDELEIRLLKDLAPRRTRTETRERGLAEKCLGHGCGGGTLPHDIMRVMHNDGFYFDTFTGIDEFSMALKLSISNGFLAAFALRNYYTHWVLLSGIENDKLRITDPTAGKTYRETFGKFAACTNGVILITGHSNKPRKDDSNDRASAFCAKMAERKRTMGDISLSFGKS